MIPFLKSNKRLFLFLLIGASLGWVYWYFNQCSNGTCLITSSPYTSMLYGSTVGFFSAKLG